MGKFDTVWIDGEIVDRADGSRAVRCPWTREWVVVSSEEADDIARVCIEWGRKRGGDFTPASDDDIRRVREVGHSRWVKVFERRFHAGEFWE